jgi:capsular polysaccharide transport system permease protein
MVGKIDPWIHRMTVFEPTSSGNDSSNEPIKFTASKDERRAERQRRRLERAMLASAASALETPPVATESDLGPAGEPSFGKRERLNSKISWTMVSFILLVCLPTLVTSVYYAFIASPQYEVEAQFSVRGSNQASIATLGLGSILGNSVQSGDSYIVASYVQSLQLLRDVKSELNIDLRTFYSRPEIDWLYRIDPDMPLEKFADYWSDMTEVSFNSTTGNTTLLVYAFTAEDSKKIADAILKVSERLVNNLSESSRQQLTLVASNQVDRAEDRMRKVREQLRRLRTEEKAFDPSQIAALESGLTSNLEGQLSGLRSRLSALLKSVSKDSPSAVVLQRQIDALEQQLADQKSKLGTPDKNLNAKAPNDDSNLAEVLNKFEELTVEQGFATQAYTTALAAFETALAEAQKQERYFATFIAPTMPQIAVYPTRLLDSFIAFLVYLATWLMAQFLYRSFRDHAI